VVCALSRAEVLKLKSSNFKTVSEDLIQKYGENYIFQTMDLLSDEKQSASLLDLQGKIENRRNRAELSLPLLLLLNYNVQVLTKFPHIELRSKLKVQRI